MLNLNSIIKKSEIKEAIILLAYAGLLNETLTKITVLFVIAGAILVWFGIRPGKVTRNLITLGVFGSYWFAYGKVIDPEVGLNFLTIIIVLKLLEKDNERDRYMIFFGIMLLISAGTLFQKNLVYVSFFAISFLMLIEDFYGNLRLPFRAKEMGKILLWVLPLTVIMFFFAPRAMNPLAMEGPRPAEGEVGYTPDVNVSEVESLSFNDSPVFQAEVKGPINPEFLYWRANTLSFTDGWNWPLMPPDRTQAIPEDFIDGPVAGIEQNIRIFAKQEFLFTLDHPNYIKAGRKTLTMSGNRSIALARHQWYGKYQVKSGLLPSFENTETNLKKYLNTSLTLTQRAWIDDAFTSNSLPVLVKEIQDYFTKEGFTYSLSPGKIPDFETFVTSKKTGFCSHYASAVALILRAKGIPTRLVSGFMGGVYNRYASFYLVGQNDAHVWIEALSDGKWRRLDPTGWVVPDRVRLGGEAFMAMNGQGVFGRKRFSFRLGWLTDAQQWFAQWDFKFYRWLEEMDHAGQEAFFQKINFNREYLFSIIPVLLALFMGIYTWHLSRLGVRPSEISELWTLLKLKLARNGIDLTLVSVAQDRSILEASTHAKKSEFLKLWNELVTATFGESQQDKLRSLKKRIGRV